MRLACGRGLRVLLFPVPLLRVRVAMASMG
jgi:hypothetical protein